MQREEAGNLKKVEHQAGYVKERRRRRKYHYTIWGAAEIKQEYCEVNIKPVV